MIIDNWAGTINIPKGLALKHSSRSIENWEKFNGNNYADVAKEYDISIQWVYKIINQTRKEFIAKSL